MYVSAINGRRGMDANRFGLFDGKKETCVRLVTPGVIDADGGV